VAIQLVAQGLLGADLAASKSPLSDGMALVDPRLALLLGVGAAISRGGWIASDVMGAPRVLFAFARDGFLPAALGRVSPRRHVPANAILAHVGISAILAITGTFEQLAILSVLSTCALYATGCAAAWRLRTRDVALAGTPIRLPAFRLWVWLAIVTMLATIALARWAEIAGLVAAILGSMLLYGLARRRPRNRRPRSDV
jgi:amino acid transporter